MSGFDKIQEREKGLDHSLTAPQMSMIALGGAIGTGLFLGSKFAIGFAGPSVILSYAIGGVLALLLIGCLAEMTVQHPTSGSFGAYAEHYVGPLAGYLVRYLYWSAIVLAVGTEVTAVGDYMGFWLPDVPALVWVIGFSGTLIAVNMLNVRAFGTLEYWFSSIKVFAIIGFVITAAVLVFGRVDPAFGFHNYGAGEGFFAGGPWGMWVAVIVSIFSYLSVEMIAVAAGEAKDPERAVRKAFRTTIVRLTLFYLTTLALIVAIAPRETILAGGSPFVTVMNVAGIPFADSILNFVVIVAALSAMNSQLYISTRMMFSLARVGDAPAALGRLRTNGAPVNALLASTIGIAVAAVVYALTPDRAFSVMLAVSMFGALFTWLMIFVTHACFRRAMAHSGEELKFRLRILPCGTLLGITLMLAILMTTIFTPEFELTLRFGIPFAVIVAASYAIGRRQPTGRRSDQGDEHTADEARV